MSSPSLKYLKVFALLLAFVLTIKAEKCLPGEFHMKTSARAGKDYATCKAWNDNTCCSANFTIELHKNQVKDLYNFHWGHCKNLSSECEKFILAEECFWSCDPRLIEWHVGKAKIKHVPVCGDYCNDWYKACENDQTCVANWYHINYTDVAQNCPKSSTCKTFKQMYGSGEQLCNKMWGESFRYVDSKCPCTRLDEPIPASVKAKFNISSTCSGSLSSFKFAAFYLAFIPLVLGIKVFLN